MLTIQTSPLFTALVFFTFDANVKFVQDTYKRRFICVTVFYLIQLNVF